MSGDGSEYQPQPLHVWFTPQVLPQAEAVHILVDETEGVRLGRVHPHKRYHPHVFAVEDVTYVNLVANSLQGRR